jgi:hypothetical protein
MLLAFSRKPATYKSQQIFTEKIPFNRINRVIRVALYISLSWPLLIHTHTQSDVIEEKYTSKLVHKVGKILFNEIK